MTIKKKIILGLAVVLIAIQFFQPLRNQAVEVPATHIERVYAVPQNVKAILVQSCYDCHSNNPIIRGTAVSSPAHGTWQSI